MYLVLEVYMLSLSFSFTWFIYGRYNTYNDFGNDSMNVFETFYVIRYTVREALNVII